MTKGGYHLESRAFGLVAEIRAEAHCGRIATCKPERDASFEEIAHLTLELEKLLLKVAA